MVWVPSAGADAASRRYDRRYDDSQGGCIGHVLPGTHYLAEYLEAYWPAVVARTSLYSCRANTAHPEEVSLHGKGRAIDLMTTHAAPFPAADAVADRIVERAGEFGVQFLVWDHWRWSRGMPPARRFAHYEGPNPHTDHLHVELLEDAGEGLLAWYRFMPERAQTNTASALAAGAIGGLAWLLL